MRAGWMTVGLVLASSCSGVSEDQILVEPNELGVASLTLRSYVEHDEAIFELRALDQHGDEVATFRRAVGAIVDLPQVADADFDASLGTEFTVNIAEERFRTITRWTQVTRLPDVVGFPKTKAFLRLPEVRSTLEHEANLVVGHPGMKVGNDEIAYDADDYSIQCPANKLRPVGADGNPIVAEGCCTTVWVDPIAPIPAGTMIDTVFIKPSTQQSAYRDMWAGYVCRDSNGNGGCSGTACYYGPCGGGPPFLESRPAPNYWYTYVGGVGAFNEHNCGRSNSSNINHANAFGNVTGTCQYKGCCNGTPTNTTCGGGSGIGYWEY